MADKVDIPGIGEVVKSDYVVSLDLEDTILMSRIGNPTAPKIWVTVDEWEGRAPKEQDPPEEIPKFTSFQEAFDAFDEKRQEKVDKGELKEFEKPPEGSLYPKEELEKLRLDELLVVMTMSYGENAVREKLYAVDGHCPKEKKCPHSCSKGEEDADS